jgi:hypothetical protein
MPLAAEGLALVLVILGVIDTFRERSQSSERPQAEVANNA